MDFGRIYPAKHVKCVHPTPKYDPCIFPCICMEDYDADATQLSHMLTVWGLRLELENMRQIYFIWN